MNRRTIDRFSSGGPFAFIVPADQHDAGAAAQLIRLVQAGGGRVQRASAPFVGRRHAYPAGPRSSHSRSPSGGGSRICSKPSRIRMRAGPRRQRPSIALYDMTAWSLDVDGRLARTVERPFEAALATLDSRSAAASRTGERRRTDLPAAARIEYVAHRDGAASCRGRRDRVGAIAGEDCGTHVPGGSGDRPRRPAEEMVRLADELGIDVVATESRARRAGDDATRAAWRSTSLGAARRMLAGHAGSSISTTCATRRSVAPDCTMMRS